VHHRATHTIQRFAVNAIICVGVVTHTSNASLIFVFVDRAFVAVMIGACIMLLQRCALIVLQSCGLGVLGRWDSGRLDTGCSTVSIRERAKGLVETGAASASISSVHHASTIR
jgi:hypothetical protein